MYAHTSPYPYTHVSASRLSDHFAIYEARSVFLPPVEIYRCLWSNKFPLEGEKTGRLRPRARFIEQRNSRAEPSRPAARTRKKEKRRYLALIKSSARKKCRKSLDKASTATLTAAGVTSARTRTRYEIDGFRTVASIEILSWSPQGRRVIFVVATRPNSRKSSRDEKMALRSINGTYAVERASC